MKKEVSPVVAVIVGVIILALIGGFYYTQWMPKPTSAKSKVPAQARGLPIPPQPSIPRAQ